MVCCCITALEREATHLTRRDGQRHRVVQWEDDPPPDEGAWPGGNPGSFVFATIDIA